MIDPNPLIQEPAVLGTALIAVTWILAEWTRQRDAAAIQAADDISLSRAQGAALLGMTAFWLWLRNRRQLAETPDHQIIEHRDPDD